MKISSIDIIRLKRWDFSAQTPVLCRINTDNGLYGYGEAGVSIMDYSLGSFGVLEAICKKLIGMDPLANDVIYTQLSKGMWPMGNGGVIMSAISAIDMALWDIKGKHFGVPLYVLLGGKQREKLRAYASQLQNGWRNENFFHAPSDLESLRVACKKAVDEGFTAVKIDFLRKTFDGKRVDALDLRTWITPELMDVFLKRVETARETLGPKIDIIMENHGNTSAETAIQFANAAAKYNIMFLEEPCSPMSPIEHKKIAERTTIPLATGERNYTRWGFLPLLENGSVSVIQPDIGNCGGITECRKIADLAEIYGVSVQTHTCNTPISVAASLHLEAAIPNFIIHEHHTVNTIPEGRATCVYDYQPKEGYFSVPELPGIGNELTEEALHTAYIKTIQ